MKNIISLLVLTLSTTLAISQSCSTYYPLTKDATFQMTNYKDGDTPVSVVDYTITEVTKKDGKALGSVHSVTKDAEGTVISEMPFKVYCKNNVFSIDMESMVDQKTMDQYKEMNLKLTSTTLDYPNDLTIGSTLKSASIKMTMDIAGQTTNIDLAIDNRKVVGEETITTAAGSFKCLVLTRTFNYKIPSLDMSESFKTKLWLAEGPGVVKQLDYNADDVLMMRSELTQYSQPNSRKKLLILHN